MPGSEADQRMDDELEDQSHAIDFQQSSEKFVDYCRQQEGGTPDIDFQFDFDFKIWGVATNELQ